MLWRRGDPSGFVTSLAPGGRVMKDNFLRPGGVVTNPCLGDPCFAFDDNAKPGQGDTVQPGDAPPYPGPARRRQK